MVGESSRVMLLLMRMRVLVVVRRWRGPACPCLRVKGVVGGCEGEVGA